MSVLVDDLCILEMWFKDNTQPTLKQAIQNGSIRWCKKLDGTIEKHAEIFSFLTSHPDCDLPLRRDFPKYSAETCEKSGVNLRDVEKSLECFQYAALCSIEKFKLVTGTKGLKVNTRKNFCMHLKVNCVSWDKHF